MIAGVDDERVIAQARRVDGIDQSAHAGIGVADKPEVGGDRLADHLLRKVPQLVVVDPLDDPARLVAEINEVVG